MGVQCIAIPFRFDDGLALCLESHSVWKKWKWNWNWTEPIQIAKLIIMFTEKCSRLPIRWYPCRKKTTKVLHLHLYNRKIKCRTFKLVSVCAVRAWFFFSAFAFVSLFFLWSVCLLLLLRCKVLKHTLRLLLICGICVGRLRTSITSTYALIIFHFHFKVFDLFKTND